MSLITIKLKNWILKKKFLYFALCKLSYFYYKKDLKVFLYNIEKDFLHNRKIYSNYDLDFDPTLEGSFRESIEIKYKIFKAISLKYNNKKIKILEIGTLYGVFTSYLSNLFTNSEIYTIDLPHTDKRFYTSYDREDKIKNFLEARNKNIQKKNINFIEMDSMNILDKFGENFFDIVFVDGDHKDPVVSLDIFNSFKILKREGFLIVDDLYSSDRPGKIGELIGHYPSKDGLNALKKLSLETNNRLDLLVKFYGPKNHFYNPMVGILRKK